MFESSINKYFSSPTNPKPCDNKDLNVKNSPEECEENKKKEKTAKIIKNNNETITMSSPEIIKCREENNEEVEYEAFSIIRELNRQLLIHQKEIQQKDEEFQTMNNYKLRYDDMARQVNILQDKLKLYETESDLMNSRIKSSNQDENKPKSELLDKEKVLNKYKDIIKEQEKTITLLKKEMKAQKKTHKNLKKEFNEISSKFSTISQHINNKERDFKLFQEEYEDKLEKKEREKIKYDEKIKDLLEIIKTQKMETDDHKYKLKNLENERKTLIKNVTNLQNCLNEEKKLNEEINEQLTIVNDLNKKFDETSNIITNLQNELEIEKSKNDELTVLNNNLIEKINAFKQKYSGENSVEHLNVIIQNKNNDIEKLKRSFDEQKKHHVSLEIKNKQLENEIKDLIFGLNLEVNNLQQWVENYLGMYYANKDIEIPELPCTVTKSSRYKIKLDSLKDSIFNVHLRLVKDLENNQELFKKANMETNRVSQKEDKFTTDITELKKEILSKDNEIFMLRSKIDNLSRELQHFKEICENKNFEIDGKTEKFNKFCEKINIFLKEQVLKIQNIPVIVNNKIFNDIILKLNFTENIYDLINENLHKIIKIFDKMVTDYELLYREKDQACLVLKNNNCRDNLINEKITLYENQLKKKEEMINMLRTELEKVKINHLIESNLIESISVSDLKEKNFPYSTQNKDNFEFRSSNYKENNTLVSHNNTSKSEAFLTFQGNCETYNSKESSKRMEIGSKSKKRIKTSNIFQENDILKSIINDYNIPSNVSKNI